jgi:hypothetical protein
MSPKLLPVLLAVGLGLTVAGCGGGNADQQANEAYANSVCTAVGKWSTQVKSLATVPSSGISTASLQKKLTQFQTATKNLVTEVKAVPPPNTSEGQDAKKQVNQLATQVEATTTAVKQAAAKLPPNASLPQIISALTALEPKLTSLSSTAQSTMSSLKQAKGSLASAFSNASACKDLGG